MTVPSVMRPIWFSKSRRSRSISAAVFFFRPNIKYAATTAASPASRRVYKRNGIFDKAPGVLSTKNMTRNAFREETRELRKSRAVSHQLSAKTDDPFARDGRVDPHRSAFPDG